MTIYVLILAFLWEGEIQVAAYNGGNPTKTHEFRTKEACDNERAKQLMQMDKILANGATLVELKCIARNAQGGA